MTERIQTPPQIAEATARQAAEQAARGMTMAAAESDPSHRERLFPRQLQWLGRVAGMVRTAHREASARAGFGERVIPPPTVTSTESLTSPYSLRRTDSTMPSSRRRLGKGAPADTRARLSHG